MTSTQQELAPKTTVDVAAQAVQAFFHFLKLKSTAGGTQQPLRAIQEPDSLNVVVHTSTQPHATAKEMQHVRKAAEAMDPETLQRKLTTVYSAYNTHGPAQGMDIADFLNLLADCRLFSNRFGPLDGQTIFNATLEASPIGRKHKAAGLTWDSFLDALRRLAAVKLSKIMDKDEALRRLLCQWVLPGTQQGPSHTPWKGLFTPVSLDLLHKYDAMLKKIFAWYASMPNLRGPVSWEHFSHQSKGMLAGRLVQLLTDFKVIPGLLSVRQVTGLLQQHNAENPALDGVLQYPHMLDMLCRCAVLLRQQVQRKLTGPWVNITELNSLKRYLKLQSLPSIQDAFALPDSPHHVATLTGSMHKMQLAQPTKLAAHWSPHHQNQQQQWQHMQDDSTSSTAFAHQPCVRHSPTPRHSPSPYSSGHYGMTHSHAASASGRTSQLSEDQSPADGVPGRISRLSGYQDSAADMSGRISQLSDEQGFANASGRMSHLSVSAAVGVSGRTSRLSVRHGPKNRVGVVAGGWDRTRTTPALSRSSSRVGSHEEEEYWREQEQLQLTEQQQEACRDHLAWREADKRRLLQHRKQRLSYDPRMPARLAAWPGHMACTVTPPYALLDPAVPAGETALNADGDGWAPMVDIVRLECPSPSPEEEEHDMGEAAPRWGELPLLSLHHVPLDTLPAKVTKLGKRSRETAWSHDTHDQLSAFENKLPTLLAKWSIEKERQQWTHTFDHDDNLPMIL